MMFAASEKRLPWASLLALSMAAFITILTEALPAALLPQMAEDLGVTQAWIGQTVTAYALGSLMAAIPLVTATRGMRRRPLLMAAVLGFALANSVTALSDSFTLIITARVVAGMAAGLLWALLAGYATRLVAPQLRGRAIAVAMVGTPLALSLGVPAGGWLGLALGWRWCFEHPGSAAVGLDGTAAAGFSWAGASPASPHGRSAAHIWRRGNTDGGAVLRTGPQHPVHLHRAVSGSESGACPYRLGAAGFWTCGAPWYLVDRAMG